MGYQALLFCPDEKTARTVTQVLSELEFTVDACNEPFAVVKKLMGQHFDAVVVDCDNEQNAILIFKSARNSTSNQASLAVAVVEGQAGVAKAFRIGANLVLTKPINIEQAKGTIRVARGLLRKSEPAKAAALENAASPKPPVARPSAPPKITPFVAERPVSPLPKKPATPAWPAPTAEQSIPPAVDDDLIEISFDDTDQPTPDPLPSVGLSASTPVRESIIPADPSVVAGTKLSSKLASPRPVSTMGAAAAPAFASVVPDSPVAAKALDHAEDVSVIEKPAELNQGKAYAETAVPTFTFGGANAPAESSGGSKKILLAVGVAAIVATGLYFGWTRMQTPAPQTPSAQAVASSPAPAPVQSAPALPEKPAPLANSQMPLPVTADSTPAPSTTTEREVPSVTLSAKTSSKPSSLATEALKPAPSQKVLKVGTASASSAADAVDAQAPSMIGIASATTPPPAFTSNTAVPRSAQSMNISQGVARGLLITKVQPVYPKTALNLRVEGTVELLATISKTGDISSVKVLSGNSQLTKAAVDAVKRWKYKPYLLNGEPVDIQTQVTINFSLPH